jgi:hypothetical protein
MSPAGDGGIVDVTPPYLKELTMSTTTTRPSATYRIDHPTITDVLSDLRIPASDLGPGDRVPRFELPTTDGGRVSTDDVATDARPMLLVFGSLTCPVTESGAGGLRELHARYGSRVRFIMVAVREAHPGASIGQPRTFEQKARNATILKAHHGFAFETAIDDLDGTVHRAFGPRPNSAYLIDTGGRIVFRAQWANVTSALEQALAAVTAGAKPRRAAVAHTLRAMAKMTGHAGVAFAAAGRGALADTWKVAPPFGAMILLSRLFSFLPKDRRGAPTMALMALGLAAAITTIALLLP